MAGIVSPEMMTHAGTLLVRNGSDRLAATAIIKKPASAKAHSKQVNPHSRYSTGDL